MKPRVGVTLARKEKPSDTEYLEALQQAGAQPILLRPGQAANLDSLSGLLLSGGEDIHPEFYHENIEPFCDPPDRERDEFEFRVLKNFLASKKPVLAVCRGIQVLNVALGGNLYQDLAQQFKQPLHRSHLSQDGLPREEKRRFRHPVRLTPGSILHEIFGPEKEVNSRHHQALKEVSPLLSVTAVSHDSVVEGVESMKHPWVIGVQWHPEATEVYPEFASLFERFAQKCSERLEHDSATPGKFAGVHVDTPDRSGA